MSTINATEQVLDARTAPVVRSKSINTRVFVSGFAAVLLLLNLLGRIEIKAPALGLVALVVLPWMSVLLDAAELPGGWKVKFREVEVEQERLVREVQWLTFLMSNFLTQYELNHLQKFAADGPFWFDYNSESKAYFERELRRMVDLNLIRRVPGTGIRALIHSRDGLSHVDGKEIKDVKQYLEITPQGLEYLKLRSQVNAGNTRG